MELNSGVKLKVLEYISRMLKQAKLEINKFNIFVEHEKLSG